MNVQAKVPEALESCEGGGMANICVTCGHEVTGVYCSNCGASVETHTTCPRGHSIDPMWNECPYCRAEQSPIAEQSRPVEDMSAKTCVICGELHFCSGCREPLPNPRLHDSCYPHYHCVRCLPDRCISCKNPVAEEDTCPHCGVSRSAPLCPRCGKPVSGKRDRKPWETRGGLEVWSSRWKGACEHCGEDFAARLNLVTGHNTFFSRDEVRANFQTLRREGRSVLEISGGESTFMACDDWDVQPVIHIRVTRADGGNMGESPKMEGNLEEEASISLTHEECRAICAQLDGPLRILLARKPWSKDTT
jgi:hypothetical protein